MGAVARRWNLMEELAQRLQQLETQARSDRTQAGTTDETTNGD